MNEKALKKIIKQLVRESLTEIFAEMKLENIVENVVSKKINKYVPKESSFQKVMQPIIAENKKNNLSTEDKKKIISDKLGVKDEMWANIYADTMSSGNPVLDKNLENSPLYVNDEEQIPVSILEDMGLMKDYSKHIGIENKKTSQEDDEWKRRRLEHEKMLNEKVKRA